MGRKDWLTNPWLWGGVAGAGLLFWLNQRDPDGGVVDVFARGKKISYGTYDDVLGIVTESPEALRVAASKRMGIDLSDDLYAATRMVRSEGAQQGDLRVHVALNDLAEFPYADTLFELLTYSTDPSRRGIYGAQYSPAVPPNYPKANHRRYATSKNPYEGDVRTAMKAIADHERGIDPSQGAVKFVDVPSLTDKTIDQLVAQWAPLKPFTLPQYGSDLVLFRREA